jgi:hypothetical protein
MHPDIASLQGLHWPLVVLKKFAPEQSVQKVLLVQVKQRGIIEQTEH